MSFKITIELDGHTEQQLMPVIHQAARRYPELFGDERLTQGKGLYVENAALLQQQIQQLMIQNRLLQAQLSGERTALSPATEIQALTPAKRSTAQYDQTESRPLAQRPALPARYQTGRGAKSVYRLKRVVQQAATVSWRRLIWLCLGREWLLIFLIFSGALLGALAVAPKLSQRLWPAPEFVESAGEGPGATSSPDEPVDAQSDTPEASETTSPADPTSKAGSHPPPPPAFQTQQ